MKNMKIWFGTWWGVWGPRLLKVLEVIACGVVAMMFLFGFCDVLNLVPLQLGFVGFLFVFFSPVIVGTIAMDKWKKYQKEKKEQQEARDRFREYEREIVGKN
jgi:hypothetical protein